MSYGDPFLHYVAELAATEAEKITPLAIEALEDASRAERYSDAALIIMLVCRGLPTNEARVSLLHKLSMLSIWEHLGYLDFFVAWLADSGLANPVRNGMAYQESEARWIETDDNGEEGLLSACRIAFADLGSWVERREDRCFGGTNLLFFLNRSRRRHGPARIYNAAAFGLRWIAPSSDDEQDTILGRIQRGHLGIRSVRLGTPSPRDFPEEGHVLDRSGA
jgi:hypothetical protein